MSSEEDCLSHHHLSSNQQPGASPMELLQESPPTGHHSSSGHHHSSLHTPIHTNPLHHIPSHHGSSHHHHPHHHHHYQSHLHSNLKVTSSPSSSAVVGSGNNNSGSTGKVKRARQRVDAGEPRNSYASITNFSSTRSSAFHSSSSSSSSVNNRLSSSSSIHNELVNCKSNHGETKNSRATGASSTTSSPSFKSSSFTSSNTGLPGSSNLSIGVGIGGGGSTDKIAQFVENNIALITSNSSNSNNNDNHHHITGNVEGSLTIGMYLNGSQAGSRQTVNNSSDIDSKDKTLSRSSATSSPSSSSASSPKNNGRNTVVVDTNGDGDLGESSAHLLRGILQKGRRVNDVAAAGAVDGSAAGSTLNCDKTGLSCDQAKSPLDNGKGGDNLSQCSDASRAGEGDFEEEDEEDDLSTANNTNNNVNNDSSYDSETDDYNSTNNNNNHNNNMSHADGQQNINNQQQQNPIASEKDKVTLGNTSSPNGSRSCSPVNQQSTVNSNGPSSSSNVTPGSSLSLPSTPTPTVTISDVKRARVENIVTNMLPRSNSNNGPLNCSESNGNKTGDHQQLSSSSTSLSNHSTSQAATSLPVNGCKKRKLYHPQQSKSNGPLDEDDEDEDEEEDALDDGVGDEEDEDLLPGGGEDLDLDGGNVDGRDAIGGGNDDDYDLMADGVDEITDLSNKSVKVEDLDGKVNDIGDSKSKLNYESMQAIMQKYKKLLEPSESRGTPKDLSRSIVGDEDDGVVNYTGKRSPIVDGNGSPFNLTTAADYNNSKAGDEDDIDGDEEEDDLDNFDETGVRPVSQLSEMTSRNRPGNSKLVVGRGGHGLTHGLQDPAQLLDEARKLVLEQEKMSKEPKRQRLILGSSSSLQSGSTTAAMVAAAAAVGTPSAAGPGAAGNYSDIEWLSDTLKAEMQANLIPSLNQIIDSVISRFCQRRAQSLRPSQGSSLAREMTESSKELTLLSQMLESKSPRTNSKSSGLVDHQQHQHQHQQQQQQQQQPLHHHHHHHHRGTPSQVAPITTVNQNTSNSKPMNGHRGSPFTLPTESAPVPKPPGPSPFSFPPPSFKSSLLFPNFPTSLPGTTSQTPPNLLHASIAQHLNSFASVFHGRAGIGGSGGDLVSAQAATSNILQPSSSSTEANLGRGGGGPGDSVNYSRENQSSSAGGGRSSTTPNGGAGSTARQDLSGGGSSGDLTGEQTEAMSLVVTPKRKRHKVTDTRITPRTVSRILNQEPLLANLIGRDLSSVSPPGLNFGLNHGPTVPPPPLVPVSLPTSVAIPNPSLHQPEIFAGPAFPFSEHARLLRESLFCQASIPDPEESDRERESKSSQQEHHHHRQQQQQQEQEQQRQHHRQQQQEQQHHHHRQQQQQQQQHSHQNAATAALQNALAANHLAMLAQANRGDASPESLHNYSSNQYGGRSENGAEGSEASLNESTVFDANTPMISFSCQNQNSLQT